MAKWTVPDDAGVSEAPERIVAFQTGIQPIDGSAGVWADAAHHGGYGTEYVRADLGSFYQEKDIDRLMSENAALRAEVERLREAAAALCIAVAGQKSPGLPAISPQTAMALHEMRAALAQEPRE